MRIIKAIPFLLLLLAVSLPGAAPAGADYLAAQVVPESVTAQVYLYENWEGTSYADRAYYPATAKVAAGPSHVLAVVEDIYTFYDKTGGVSVSDTLDSIFGLGGDYTYFHAQVIYDQYEDRYVLVAGAYTYTGTPTAYYCLVSFDGADPTSYYYYSVLSNGLPDSINLGYDSSKWIYITANKFDLNTYSFLGAELMMFRKSEIYAGGSATYYYWLGFAYEDASDVVSLVPSQSLSSDTYEYFLSSRWDGGSDITIWKSTVATDPPSAPARQATMSATAYALAPNYVQSGGADTLRASDNRLQEVEFRDGILYTSMTLSNVTVKATKAASRLIKVNASTNVIANETLIYNSSYDYFLPTMKMLDDGCLIAVCGYSGSADFAGSFVVDVNTLGTVTLVAGEGYYNLGTNPHRFSLWTGAAVDPSDGAGWVISAYALASGGWGTRLGNISCATTTTTVTTTTETTTTTGGGDDDTSMDDTATDDTMMDDTTMDDTGADDDATDDASDDVADDASDDSGDDTTHIPSGGGDDDDDSGGCCGC
jgi:hypothetical protein